MAGDAGTLGIPRTLPVLVSDGEGGREVGCVSSAVAETLEQLFGRGQLDMEIHSAVTDTTRVYDDAEAWLDDVTNARIWLGYHFRDAMDDARAIGTGVADAVVDRAFRPADG